MARIEARISVRTGNDPGARSGPGTVAGGRRPEVLQPGAMELLHDEHRHERAQDHRHVRGVRLCERAPDRTCERGRVACESW